MDVGLVDEDDGVLGSVSDCVLEVGARGAGTGRVVRVADVDDAGVGGGGEQRLYVVTGFTFGICEGKLEDGSAGELGGPHGGFVTGIGGDEGTVSAGKGEDGVMERGAGA